MTLPVTQLLQSKSIDICDGLHIIQLLKALFITHKNALTLTEKIKIAETMPRLIETQLHKSNTPAESV